LENDYQGLGIIGFFRGFDRIFRGPISARRPTCSIPPGAEEEMRSGCRLPGNGKRSQIFPIAANNASIPQYLFRDFVIRPALTMSAVDVIIGKPKI
jgi:hypothetical protein